MPFRARQGKPNERLRAAVAPPPPGALKRALALLTLLLIVGPLVHLEVGARWIAPETVLQALFHYDPRGTTSGLLSSCDWIRLAAALLTGAALGIAGCCCGR